MTDRNPISPRRIGIDLDNTIIDYEAVIRQEVGASGLVAPIPEGDKRALRDALRAIPDGESHWIRMQARIYGPGLAGAVPFAGAPEFVRRARAAGIELVIVSHKTVFADADPAQYDLREAARRWLRAHGFIGCGAIEPAHVFFESTREEKIARIAGLGVSAFVDDLVEVFAEPEFPPGVERWLFSPGPVERDEHVDRTFPSWEEIERHVLGGA